jgi:hypothetical protein
MMQNSVFVSVEATLWCTGYLQEAARQTAGRWASLMGVASPAQSYHAVTEDGGLVVV